MQSRDSDTHSSSHLSQGSSLATGQMLHHKHITSRLFLFLVFSVICITADAATEGSTPSLDGTSKEPIFAVVDDDVFVDCKVNSISNYTLLWRFIKPSAREEDDGDILVAGKVLVSSDPRYKVLHENGSDVWILEIKKVKSSDSGIYVCELNTRPVKRVARILAVSEDMPSDPTISVLEVDHNYTDCCVRESVPRECHDFCQFKGLISETHPTGTSIQSCIHHLGSITKCLADGRDHMPCCRQQNIPEACRPVCVGNFSLTTVLDHYTCMHYTAPVLACIAEGIQILPPQPHDVLVEPISSTQVNVSWSFSRVQSSSIELIDQLQINVTQLHTFDGIGVRLSPEKEMRDPPPASSPTGSSSDPTSTPAPSLYGLQIRYSVPGNASYFVISDLKPYTMYEISIKSINKAGASLPLDPIRTLTLQPESDSEQSSKPKRPEKKKPPKGEDTTEDSDKESESGRREGSEKESPASPSSSSPESEKEEESAASPEQPDGGRKRKLPDSKKCCRDQGVAIDRCVDVLCDPVKADQASLTDLMICAPWANVTFKCMADGNDHTACCKQRGVGGNCLDFCSGRVKKIDFRHFVCLDQISTFSSCVLDHYGVLPGPPVGFMVINVHHDWAIVKWKPPKKLPQTVTSYLIHWRDVTRDSGYNVTKAKNSPFLLDRLAPGGRYEVYVKAANEFGTSDGSSRVVFSTPPIYTSEEVDLRQSAPAYNETQCCMRAGLHKDCLPLCAYRVKVTDMIQRGGQCAQNLPTLARCAAGGRNHIPCCRRRGVADGCLNICAGLIESSPYVVAARCADDLGKILQCMEEGAGLLPGMPVDFHATLVTKDTIHLEWESAAEDVNASINFQVRFGRTDSDIPLHPLEHDSSYNTTNTNAILTGLQPGVRYSMYVVASNLYGISLPSLVLVVNTSSDKGPDSTMVQSNIGPPHSISVLHQSVDTITFKWMPPLYVPPDSKVKYIVHYKPVNGTAISRKNVSTDGDWSIIETSFNTMFLMNLTYDTEYAITIQSINDRDRSVKSALSEVALVWTDPAIPASVNLPIIIPAGPIVEGSNVTFMCIGIGTPTPVLSLLINGHVVVKQERRHISLTVINVKRNLTSISCYASNGFTGRRTQAAQSSIEIRVRYRPKVTAAPAEVRTVTNAPIRLQCEVTGNPQPRVIWFKDTADGKQQQVMPTSRISFVTVSHSDKYQSWINSLIIKNANDSDDGDYHCMGTNDLGQDAAVLQLHVDNSRNYTNSAKDCCQKADVSPACQKVCVFDVDIDMALQIPECYQDLDKLMTCAADGSDHRSCCRRRGVPGDCVRWCAGLKVAKANLCSLSAAQDIMSCFDEGKALLPGPPVQVHVKRFVEKDKVLIEWNPPEKNADLVQWYRVFWRPVGSRDLNRNQTEEPHFELQGLDSKKMYEFVVKAGNHHGLSLFTDPLVISMDNFRSTSAGNRLLKLMVGVTSISIIVIVIGALVAYAYKNQYFPRIHTIRLRSTSGPTTPTRGVSFENPSYLKDGPVVQFNPPSNVEVNANYKPVQIQSPSV